MRIFHYAPSITRRDAIGYSLSFLHRYLLRLGIPSYLVCDTSMVAAAPPFTMGFSELRRSKPTADDLVLFHYSFVDNNAAAIMDMPCRKVLIYHNITPGHFFRSFGQPMLADACDAGRAYLTTMRKAFDAVVADSAYNAAELVDAGYIEPKVIPVFYDADFYADGTADPNGFLCRRLLGEISLVFIGRFVPNKRPDNLIRATAALKRLTGKRVRLRLHGKVWDVGYFNMLRRLSEAEGVEHEISFEMNQPQTALRNSLASADAFVSMSEHEGFMVPLVEAFSSGCPVIALRSSAVTETCGAAGLLVDEPDPELVAAHIALTLAERDLRHAIIRSQSERAFDFSEQRTINKWNSLLRDFMPAHA